jgi:hypothetical protein
MDKCSLLNLPFDYDFYIIASLALKGHILNLKHSQKRIRVIESKKQWGYTSNTDSPWY